MVRRPVAPPDGVALVPDTDRRGGWTLLVDGVPQSYVDLTDPTYLAFDYVRRIGDVLDLVAPAGRPLRVVHLGGAAMTLPRYVVATRPRSRQLVVEPDAELVDLVRAQLPWGRGVGVRVRVDEGRATVTTMTGGAADALVVDAFTAGKAPSHLTTVESLQDAARVLGEHGTYLCNLADGPPLGYARRVLAAALGTWPEVALLADASVLRGRRFGNLVLVGSHRPLPVPALTRRSAGAAFPARVLDTPAVRALVGGAAPSEDSDPAESPDAPPDVWRTGR